jgi:hypothetical protein
MSSDFDGSLDRTAEFVAGLPGLDSWVPEDGGMQVLAVLSLGAAISRVDQLECEQLLKRIAKSVLSSGRPSPEDVAELNSAALLSVWANRVGKVFTKKGEKTPDFEADVGGTTVECEATNSERKSHHLDLESRSSDLVQRIQSVLHVPGLRVRFTDDADDSDFHDIVAASTYLLPGESRESVGRWFVQAYDAPVQPDEHAGNPTWWLRQYAQPATLQSSAQVTFAQNSQRVENRSSIEVHWTLSTKSYINSLSKKENAEQASGTCPFVVLCDVTQLPGAFGWYADKFAPILSTWSQKLSAVILFRRGITGFDSLQFEYQVHVNSNAKIQVPTEISLRSSGELTIPFNIARQLPPNAG